MSLMRFEQYEARKNEAATDFFSNEDFDKRVIRFEAYLDAAITLGSIKQAANSSYMTDEELRFCHFQMDSIPDYIKPAGFRLEHRASGAQGLKFRAENWFKDIWDKIVKFFEDLFKSEGGSGGGGGGSSSGPSVTSTAQEAASATATATGVGNAAREFIIELQNESDHILGPLGGKGAEDLLKLIDVRDNKKADEFLQGMAADNSNLDGAFGEVVNIIKKMYGEDASGTEDGVLERQANTAFGSWVKNNIGKTTARTKAIIEEAKPGAKAFGVSVAWEKANALVVEDTGVVNVVTGLTGSVHKNTMRDDGSGPRPTNVNNTVMSVGDFHTLMAKLEELGKTAENNAKKIVADLSKSHADEALKTVKWLFDNDHRESVKESIKNNKSTEDMEKDTKAKMIDSAAEDKRRAKKDIVTMVKFVNFVRMSEISINNTLAKISSTITAALKDGILEASKNYTKNLKVKEGSHRTYTIAREKLLLNLEKQKTAAMEGAKTPTLKKAAENKFDKLIKFLNETMDKQLKEIETQVSGSDTIDTPFNSKDSHLKAIIEKSKKDNNDTKHIDGYLESLEANNQGITEAVNTTIDGFNKLVKDNKGKRGGAPTT